jgi:hypothetical protein
LGFKIGEIIPINKDLGFLYNLEFESHKISDQKQQTNNVQRVVFSVGVGV